MKKVMSKWMQTENHKYVRALHGLQQMSVLDKIPCLREVTIW